MARSRSLLPILCCVALAACGGGGSSGSVPAVAAAPGPVTGSAPVPAATAASTSVTISITVPVSTPAASAKRRSRLFVSPNTQSAAVAVNGGAPVLIALGAAAPNCATTSSGRACTATVAAPIGSDSFSVALFASTDGSGAALSTSTTATIVAGQANAVTMTLDGIVASIGLSLAQTSPPAGTPATIALTVTAKDASGAIIVGSDPFANPITLTDSDTSGATKLSRTLLTAPSDAAALSVAYTGAALTSAVFSASSTGVAPAAIAPATLTPQAAAPPSTTFADWPTYGYDAQRSGFNPATNGITPAAVNANLHVAWHITNNGAAQLQPIVMAGVAGHTALVVVGSYSVVQAYDATTGVLVWQRALPKQDLQTCGQSGLAGTAQYDRADNALFVAAGNGQSPNHVVLYRLDPASGGITGQTDLTPTLLAGEGAGAHTAVTLANGRAYVGIGSNCEGGPGLVNWRGRVVSVDPASMALNGTFYTTWNQGGNYGGGGVWGWGGVSVDPSGNVYVAAGNAETNQTLSPQVATAPFVATDNEQAGYAENLIKLSPDLTTVEGHDYPGFNFNVGGDDLDYTGSPVIYTPPLASGCSTLSATQGKGGALVVNQASNLAAPPATYTLSVPSGAAYYLGNPAYSPNTGLLYAAITSSGASTLLLPPGLAAISGCGTTVAWTTAFGPDSTAYGEQAHPPRSAPSITSGGVIFMGTPCTPDSTGTTCGAPDANRPHGALWAIDATNGHVLNNGKPLLITYDVIRMAPSTDGLWLWVIDQSGNLFALTVDPTVPRVPAAVVRSGHFIAPTARFRAAGSRLRG